MVPGVVRLLGYLVVFACIVLLLMVWANTDARASGGRDLSGLLWGVAVGLPIAWGLIIGARWAAAILGGVSATYGTWYAIEAAQLRGWVRTVNLLIAAVFLIPLMIAAWQWRSMTWLGKRRRSVGHKPAVR
jgi:hypothetical protein